MELKQIPVEKVYANFYQPREKFDKEQITELAESILSNGLINPISVRQWTNGRFMIVAGERRWRAHKVAGLKIIPAFVKSYDNEGQWMVESLIENVHRENLSPFEKGKYLLKIKQIKKIDSNKELSKITGISESSVRENIDNYEFVKKTPAFQNTKHKIIRSTSGLEDKERKKIISFTENKKMSGSTFEEDFMPIYKKSTDDVKKALLDDRINVEQAQRISKLSTEREREKAIKQHSAIKNVEQNVERNVKNQTDFQAKRSWDKRLMDTRNWINSFRGNVTESRNQLEKTFKILIIATKFLPVMDDKQKERLNYDLDRFLETLEKSKQIAEKIQGYVEK